MKMMLENKTGIIFLFFRDKKAVYGFLRFI